MNTSAFKTIRSVEFPEYTNVSVNMMPFVFGDNDSLPEFMKQYANMINSCNLEKGSVAYLTVHESFVEKDISQRRSGIHVEAPNCPSFNMSWGGGAWGGMSQDKGIYMASTDGLTSLYNEIIEDRDKHGGCNPSVEPVFCQPNIMYWITDRTPHEALPSLRSGFRQFFRVVSEEISVWYSQHNTENPLGVKPTCPITDFNKFNQ